MPALLIQTLAAVLLAAGALLAWDSGTVAPDASFVGGHTAVCADDWTSADDPELALARKTEYPADVGYHAPLVLRAPQPADSSPLRTHFARAPPAS